MLLLDGNLLSSISTDVLISMGTAIASVIAGYIVMRERILKTEMKISTMTDYIDRKNELLENKINDHQKDVVELKENLKETSKETSKALAENTLAIRELKTVLDMIKGQLGVKGQRRVSKFDDSQS